MKIGHVSLCELVVFSPNTPRCGIAISHGNSVSHFFRNIHNALLSGCTCLHPAKSVGRPPSPGPLQHLFSVDLFDDGSPERCEWYLSSFHLSFSNYQ